MQDLLIVFPLTMLMGTTDVAPALTRKRPSGNLFAIPLVFLTSLTFVYFVMYWSDALQ